MTHGVPAFSDRSVGARSLVNPGMRFQHAAKLAIFERTLPCNPPAGQRVQDHPEFEPVLAPRPRIARAKCKAAFTKDFHECAKVRRNHRQTSQHIFGNNQSKHFSAEGWNNDDGRFRKRRIEFRFQKSPRKSNMPCQRWILRSCSSDARSGPSPMMSSSHARFCASRMRAASNKCQRLLS